MIEVQTSDPRRRESRAVSHSPYRITSATEVTDPAELDALLEEYYAVIVGKIRATGMVNDYTPSMLKASFWPNLHKVLPPAGRLMLVRDAGSRLLGCSTLHVIGPGAAEIKRLFIRPEANGNGLGQAMVAAQIDEARAMGCRRLMVNIIRGNRESIRIFEAHGFRYVPRYPGCSDPIEADPFFVYMRRDLR